MNQICVFYPASAFDRNYVPVSTWINVHVMSHLVSGHYNKNYYIIMDVAKSAVLVHVQYVLRLRDNNIHEIRTGNGTMHD